MTNDDKEPRRFFTQAPFHDATWDFAPDAESAAIAYASSLFSKYGQNEEVATVRVTETKPNSGFAIAPMRIIKVRRTFTIERET